MEKVLITGHKNPDTDSICSSIVMEKIAKHFGVNAEAVRLGNLNKETEYVFKYLNKEPQRMIEKVDEGQKLILVDHNEAGQSVDNRDNAEILAVIDHHRISDFKTATPLYYFAKPVGCTATILYEIMKEKNIEISKEDAILLISAISSDTLSLKSPTCTDEDVKAFNELENIAGIDAKAYALDMLKAGTDISDLTADKIINLDAKLLEEGGKRIVINQVNTAEIDDVFSRKEEIVEAMNREIEEKNIDLFIFVITDIINTNSKIIVLGNSSDIAEKAFNKKLDSDNSMMLEGVVSRKKQIVPPIVKCL